MQLEVYDVHRAAEGVVVADLRHPRGEPLPPFDPGAHLEITLPNGLVRHYSICSSAAERHRYCIGVGLAANGRGGSQYVHERLGRGQRMEVSTPRNNFPLRTDAEDYVFIAGGIGITPILSMIRWCVDHGKRWSLHYSVRSRDRAAFREVLEGWSGLGSLRMHVDDEAGRFFDPAPALQDLPAQAQVYCCGPTALMEAVRASAHAPDDGRLHFEWFTPKQDLAASEALPFTALIRSTGRRLEVPADRSLLEVLEQHGIAVPSSCREGLCATCETGVVSGVPDHRDSVLSEAQRQSGRSIMICVSRARSSVLELDL
ncbi:PDR/VanB family oxidoreductase [Methylibium petroleiphilum]|uniref:PDR/VanB family oxidoreductase n=1 Tax=Methylibium petroleiphilum TaxID=105560 RepID=UPI003D2D5E8F